MSDDLGMCGAETTASIFCRLPKGHHGRHACAGHCDETWPNENETRPCPSTEAAVLGVVGPPVLVRCGLLFDHDGPHRMAMSWEESVGPSKARFSPAEEALWDILRYVSDRDDDHVARNVREMCERGLATEKGERE